MGSGTGGGPQKEQEGFRRDLSLSLLGERWLQALLGSAPALKQQQQVVGNAWIHLGHWECLDPPGSLGMPGSTWVTAITSQGKVWSDWGDTSAVISAGGRAPVPTLQTLTPRARLALCSPHRGMLSDTFSLLSFC